MRIACSINKATDTQLEYVIIIAFPQQQWFCERVTIVRIRSIIYLLTAIGLSPGGSTHLHTNNTQNNTNNNRTTQIQANVEECGPFPVFASFTLAFAL
jgi:hypothetical protein